MDKKFFIKALKPAIIACAILLAIVIFAICFSPSLWPLLFPVLFMNAGIILQVAQTTKKQKPITDKFIIQFPIFWLFIMFGLAIICLSIYMAFNVLGESTLTDKIVGSITMLVIGIMILLISLFVRIEKIQVDGLNITHKSFLGKVSRYTFKDIKLITEKDYGFNFTIRGKEKDLIISKIHKDKLDYIINKASELGVHIKKKNK